MFNYLSLQSAQTLYQITASDSGIKRLFSIFENIINIDQANEKLHFPSDFFIDNNTQI